MRSLVQSGYLGDGPVHMDSYFCYKIGRSGYAGALFGDPNHWVRRLPGKLFQNIISHGVARIAEFLSSDSPEVIAHGFVSPLLKSMGESEIIDELRVIISEQAGTTAYFTFSSQMRPDIHEFRIYGNKERPDRRPGHGDADQTARRRIQKLSSNVRSSRDMARQHLGNLKVNLGKFLARDFHMKSGMKYLIEAFYRSIVEDTPAPIPYREILLTAKIMDAIFVQLAAKQSQIVARFPVALHTGQPR